MILKSDAANPFEEQTRIGNPWHGLCEVKFVSGEWFIQMTTDTGSVVFDLTEKRTSAVYRQDPWINFAYTKPGQPAVSTTSGETAEGKEWRNGIIAPAAFGAIKQGGGSLFSRTNISRHFYPFTDAGGNCWVWSLNTLTISPDFSGSVSIRVYKSNVFHALDDSPAYTVITQSYPAGTFTDIDTYSEVASVILQDIKSHGRSALYSVFPTTRQWTCAVLELTIAGTGALVADVVTGLSISLSVLAPTADCEWTLYDDVDSSVTDPSRLTLAERDAQCAATPNPGSISADDSEVTVYDRTSKSKRIIGGWYDGSDVFVPVYAHHEEVKIGSTSTEGTFETTKPAAIGPCNIIDNPRDYTEDLTITSTLSLTIGDSGVYSDGVVYIRHNTYDYTSLTDGGGIDSGAGSLTQTVNGVTTFSETTTYSGGVMSGSTSGVYINPQPNFFSVGAQGVVGSVDFFNIGPTQFSAGVYGLVFSRSNPATGTVDGTLPGGGSRWRYTAAQGEYLGFATKAGLQSGFAMSSGSMILNHTGTQINPAYTTCRKNPTTGTWQAVLGKSYPCWYV